MNPNSILTKNEYVYSRRTTLDTLMFYSWIPFFVVMILLGIAAFNENAEGMRVFGFSQVPLLALTVICRNVYAEREALYIEDYYHKYLPSTK